MVRRSLERIAWILIALLQGIGCGCGEEVHTGVDKRRELPPKKRVTVSRPETSTARGHLAYVGALLANRKVKVSSELGGFTAPMAFGVGGKSVLWAPLATAIMWGLGFSTLLILTMVPAYYAILEDIGYLPRHRHRRKADTLKEIDMAFDHDEFRPFMKKQRGGEGQEGGG